ncbi:MAG: electron transfer flavoprotein subunit beta/FixA family protein, partial [Gammaproteobacteria bacterium]|nr:electron transfer flavoprotein subunit beta/FixA family protein [Gammaproteobacteria bacterium]
MKILVPVKRVIDANIKVRVSADNSAVDLNNVKMSMNPFCEIAVEEAVRLKEKGIASEIVAITIGDEKSQEQLRTAMALGVDRSIWIEQAGNIEPLSIAKLLKAVVDKESPDLVILGKQSIDGDNN